MTALFSRQTLAPATFATMAQAKKSTRKTASAASASKAKAAKKSAKPKSIPHTHKPADMSDREWQTALRRQIAQREDFAIENTGEQRVYSDYRVYSPASKNTYRVALRSRDNTLNFCSCPDFRTNLLGTCKHIEAVRLMLEKQRGIKRLLAEVPEIPYSSLYVSYDGPRRVKLRIGTTNTAAFENWSLKYFDGENTLLPAAFFDIKAILHEAAAIDPGFRAYDDALDLIIAGREAAERNRIVDKKGLKLLTGLSRMELFPYQQDGVLFAARAGRAILADDMGLGKTLQAITWARLMQEHFNCTKVLIVCPTSLKYQWKTEIRKFTDSEVCVIEGGVPARKALYEEDESYFKVLSYHVAGNDWQFINEMKPDIIILDEAQRIKNWRAKISQNIKRLHSPYTMVLTGTPVENNIEELYSLVQYVDQHLLGSLHHFLSAHQIMDEAGKVTGYRGLNEIGEQLGRIMLRRRKKDVLKQLPARMDKNLFVPMTEQQQELHTQYADSVARLVNKWRRYGFLSEKERQMLLNNLNMMRMVCDSTYIIDQQTNHQTKLDELFSILDELFVQANEKVVIFSQWERMTRLIARGLEQRGIGYEYLHGGIPSKDREALFTNFNNDPETRVFLSTDAGGVGLNLQSASNLINMDIPWNPAVLEQRIGRIYRMGQERNVSIINIIAQESIEHQMLAKLKFKSAVAAGILDQGEDSIFAGEDKFKKFIELVESVTEAPASEAASFDAEEQAELALPGAIDPPVSDREEMARFDEPSEMQQPAGTEPVVSRAPDPANLVQRGIRFLSQLAETLADPAATKALTESITETNAETGQTYLKIPVQNSGVVEQTLSALAKLFGGR
jgi:ERCC4-related helicase/predicted nucleic acid-binding Zn finger protein